MLKTRAWSVRKVCRSPGNSIYLFFFFFLTHPSGQGDGVGAAKDSPVSSSTKPSGCPGIKEMEKLFKSHVALCCDIFDRPQSKQN